MDCLFPFLLSLGLQPAFKHTVFLLPSQARNQKLSSGRAFSYWGEGGKIFSSPQNTNLENSQHLSKLAKFEFVFHYKHFTKQKSGNVQFSTQNQVKSKTKKDQHVRKCPILHSKSSHMNKKRSLFHVKASEEQKKVITLAKK